MRAHAKPTILQTSPLEARRIELTDVPAPGNSAASSSRLWPIATETEPTPSVAEQRQPVWEPIVTTESKAPTTSHVLHRERTRVPVPLGADIEREWVVILTQAPRPGESHHEAGHRREREAAALLMQLSAADAHELHRRLRLDRKDDPIVAAFSRVLVDRRQRLCAVLDRGRRTLAIASRK